MFSLIYARLNDWVNNREAGDLRRQHGHYDVLRNVTIDPSCSLPLMSFTSGAPIPPGAVTGGYLDDGTNLYVVYVDDSTNRPAYGNYK